MVRRRSLLASLGGLAGVLAGVAGPAGVASSWGAPRERDPVVRALDSLARGRSYKVRLQAAAVLVRFIDDPRAAHGLVVASAADRHPLVRATTVKLIGRHVRGDVPRARAALERARGDRSAAVRAAAGRALADFEARAGGAPLGVHAGVRDAKPGGPRAAGKVVVGVRPMGDRTGRASAGVRERFRQEVAKNLAAEPELSVADPQSGNLNFVIDGAIKRLELVTGPFDVEAICEVSMVVSRPPRGIILTASGEAAVQRPKMQFRPAVREQMETEALVYAVKSAHENLARFFATQ